MPRPTKKPPNRSDGRWEVKIAVGKDSMTNKPIRKSFYSSISKADAEQQASAYLINTEAHKLIGDVLISQECTFKEWAELWLDKYKYGKVKQNTYMETYERTVNNYLIPQFGNMKLDIIKPIDIEAFTKIKCVEYSDSVMSKMRLCLNGIFETAIDNDLCRKNPTKNVSFESKVEHSIKSIYTQDENDSVLNFCDTHTSGIYIRILLELGLRSSELCGLKKSDFDLLNKVVHIQRAITRVNYKPFVGRTKNKSSNRYLPLSSTLTQTIQALNINLDVFLLRTSNGKEMTPEYFSKYIYSNFRKDLRNEFPDIKSLSPHELRHTCGTLLYTRTKDIYAVSKYLGHANILITTKLYVHNSVELLRSNLGIK